MKNKVNGHLESQGVYANENICIRICVVWLVGLQHSNRNCKLV